MLQDILAQNPLDAFARYGLAMEYSARGETDEALRHFALLLEAHPDYVPGYFMAAQTLARAGRLVPAKEHLEAGIAVARRTGNRHAQGEMEAMLDDLNVQL